MIQHPLKTGNNHLLIITNTITSHGWSDADRRLHGEGAVEPLQAVVDDDDDAGDEEEPPVDDGVDDDGRQTLEHEVQEHVDGRRQFLPEKYGPIC